MIALKGTLAIAAVSTLGDFMWAEMHLRHRMYLGLGHGLVLFLSVGLFLGWSFGRPLIGALSGALIGLIAAASFYVLARYVGYSAMFFIWAFIWLALAYVPGRLLRRPPISWNAVLARGVAAAIGSGVAFYAISGIWRPFNPHGWDYAVHYISWVIAFLPGFAALTFNLHAQPKQ
jgi:hypothetical protein